MGAASLSPDRSFLPDKGGKGCSLMKESLYLTSRLLLMSAGFEQLSGWKCVVAEFNVLCFLCSPQRP